MNTPSGIELKVDIGKPSEVVLLHKLNYQKLSDLATVESVKMACSPEGVWLTGWISAAIDRVKEEIRKCYEKMCVVKIFQGVSLGKITPMYFALKALKEDIIQELDLENLYMVPSDKYYEHYQYISSQNSVTLRDFLDRFEDKPSHKTNLRFILVKENIRKNINISKTFQDYLSTCQLYNYKFTLEVPQPLSVDTIEELIQIAKEQKFFLGHRFKMDSSQSQAGTEAFILMAFYPHEKENKILVENAKSVEIKISEKIVKLFSISNNDQERKENLKLVNSTIDSNATASNTENTKGVQKSSQIHKTGRFLEEKKIDTVRLLNYWMKMANEIRSGRFGQSLVQIFWALIFL